MPTYSLLLTLSSFNIQLAISKEISSGKRPKTVISNSLLIMTILNIALITITLIFRKTIAIHLLHNKNLILPLITLTLTLPFISLGYIIKGYFYGKQNVTPHMLTNITEQIIKLILIIIILPKFHNTNPSIQITIFIALNIITELSSCIIMYLFLPKTINLKNTLSYINKQETYTILSLTLPSTSGRLIANIGYFLEPIILTYTLLKTNYTNNYITTNYGIYNTYAIQVLLIPSFFISAISSSIIPEVSKLYKQNNIKTLKKRIIESIILSLIIGITFTTIIYLFHKPILTLLFNTTKQNISFHVNNILNEGELERSTVKDYLTVRFEGMRKVTRKIKSYNLDMIISIGFRVNSKQGILFRKWANKVLKEYLLKNEWEPTVKNLYIAAHSGISSKAEELDISGMEKQLEQIIKNAGLEVNKESKENCKWLMQKNIALIILLILFH